MKTWYQRHREQFPYTDETGQFLICLRHLCDSPRMDDGGPHGHLCRECSARDRRRAIEEVAEMEPDPERYEPDPYTCPECGGPTDNGHSRALPPEPYVCSACEADERNGYGDLREWLVSGEAD